LSALVGCPYVWGGNWSQGIEKMKSLYPMSRKLTFHERANWLMQGVDCSGLLYEVTEGATPRNTSDLIHVGDFVDIQNKSPAQIKRLIRPLDLIVWRGHVIIALDENITIESRARRGGVVLTDLEQRLEQIIIEDKKTPSSNIDPDNKDAYYIKTNWI
jgi:cell wall-associated NlpC family hydrolase